ncbi:hypothetical protein [Parasitella parasitica]|uniref:BZIP domain-containing protein n=1 Tax=Parasitella parasitica TaxID=35722 RepID=A0A0B7MWB5_9FUNG|nr:hypothetical protein [Parasitella parasitica]
MENNTFNTFTWILEDNPPNKQPSNDLATTTVAQQQPQQTQEMANLSNADLFQFLLGEEAEQAALSQPNSAFHTDEDSSANENLVVKTDPTSTTRKPKRSNGGLPAASTGRLDFRPINDQIPDSQLKAMTSKERRQLRNKISARNFRNRRKGNKCYIVGGGEYIGSLEDELNQQKAENSQLKLELKWIKQKMEALQKENDKLRVDLVLSGINLTHSNNTQAPTAMSVASNNSPSPYLLDSTNLLNSTMNISSFSSNSPSSSSDNSTLSSPPKLFSDFPENWDFVLPTENNQNSTDTYLSHALLPDWNINRILEKETSTAMVSNSSSSPLIQQYPLLAPALMSIVLAHAMTMSTDEILATAKLNPLPTMHVAFDNKNPFRGSNMMTDKEAKAVWDILEPLTLMQARNEKLAIKPVEQNEQPDEQPRVCLILWIQSRICRYLCEFAASHCTANTLPSSSSSPGSSAAAETEQETPKKFILCRQFQKAKRYITACQ